jgi:hypothetical protein
MTGEPSPHRPKDEPDLARFLQDWTALWREELRAQSSDTEGSAGAMELWRAAMTAWTSAFGIPPLATAGEPPRTPATAAASDSRDAEVQRLARRIDELEARLARLETPRRRRG